MEQEQKEQKVYFKDLVFAALYRWKWLVVAAVVCGLLMGGLGILSQQNKIQLTAMSMTPETQHRIEQLEYSLNASQELAESHMQYLKESVLMSLDPYNAYSEGCYFFVVPQGYNLEEYDPTPAIIQGYVAELRSSGVAEKLAQELNLESWQVTELVSADVARTSALGVTARGRNEEEAAKIADAYLAQVRALTEKVSESVARHTLTPVPYQKEVRLDSGLYDAQYNARQKLVNLKNTVTTAITELEKLKPSELMSGKSKPVLFAAVGVVLGVCLVVAVVWIGHIGGSKVYSARVLKDQTQLRILGCVSSGKKTGALQRKLRKWEGRAQDANYDVIAVNIRNRCDGAVQLLLAGSYPAEAAAALTEKLKALGITCLPVGQLAASAAAMEQLRTCDAVVLLESCGVSRYHEIQQSQETVADNNKPLLGCVLIDG